MSTEQETMRSVIKDLAKKIKTERKICNNIDKMNSDLLRGISETRSSAKKFVKSIEKEKKARAELDHMCYDLAKEIEERKAEIEALRDEQRRIQTEVEEERRMLQMAEVWREEQAQMKLNEAKLILENKYAELHSFISGLRAFLKSSGAAVNEETRAEVARQAFDLVKDMKFFGPESDKGSAVFEDSRAGDVVWLRPRHGKGMSMDRSSNPHIVRAMKGHVEWPWRMKENGTKMLH